MNWTNKKYPTNLIHIHGTNDKIFPIKKIQNAIEIPNGGHFMIVSISPRLSSLIFDCINEDQYGQ